ncbi:HpcH/HpaI aldolase/citrate lyase family protein [Actinopolymorpha alba]|uniref:HpcH/HpaI aldolase/citrate lyase family protein n=1 Tax=Actinopolymorpha alba TaxID=533267 RepID=UPI00036DA224|nr:CoA ester lyase [Actinopolymorpha alba]
MAALTWLYVPGDRPERIRKAMTSAADVVIVDLEDAVAPAHKPLARAALAEVVEEFPGRAVEVRVNAIDSAWLAADLDVVAVLPPNVSVRIPKVERIDDVATIIARVGTGRALTLLLESARGVERAAELASAHPQVAAIGLGEADLCSQLAISEEDALGWVRSRIVVASAAAGLRPPAMSAFTDVSDLARLARSCQVGRSLGMLGRAAIHPRQLPVIEAAFAPSSTEVARARAVIDALAQAEVAGDGTAVLADGRFLDVAMRRGAERVLELAERTGTTPAGAGSEGAS